MPSLSSASGLKTRLDTSSPSHFLPSFLPSHSLFSLLSSLFLNIHPPNPTMQTCTGSTKDPAHCPCTRFTPKPPPKDGRCDSCGHRRSAHEDSAPNANNKYVERLLKNMAATAVHEDARKETLQGFRPQESVDPVRVFPSSPLPLSERIFTHPFHSHVAPTSQREKPAPAVHRLGLFLVSPLPHLGAPKLAVLLSSRVV